MKLKELTIKDRPRERLIEKGANALNDIELLAIMIGSGTKKENVLDIALKITKKYTLKELKDLTYQKLIMIPGIKSAKACQLLAAFELARRAHILNIKKESLTSARQIYDYLYADFYLEDKEAIAIIYLDCKLKPIKKSLFNSVNSFDVNLPIKIIIHECLDNKAYGIVMAHNHPSNDLKPSEADLNVTFQLIGLLNTMEINLFDHLIIGREEYYSFLEHGLLDKPFEYNYLGDEDEKSDI